MTNNINIDELSLNFNALYEQIMNCQTCNEQLPYPAKPILQLGLSAKILIIGQAPGLLAHQSGIPWNDKSGERLREWLGINRDTFYDPSYLSILPMGFCFPGYKNGADAPPLKICAQQWHQKIMSYLRPQITLCVGRHAQHYYLPEYSSLTEAVAQCDPADNKHIVLPHPSGRNNRWIVKHPEFTTSYLPKVRARIQKILA
jgi:uracil-DNA glycosylase family 4